VKLLWVILTSLVGLVLLAILCVFYLLKCRCRSLNVQHLVDSAKRIPTIPMMDPDSFETAEGPTQAGIP
jgi:hypothetical protein